MNVKQKRTQKAVCVIRAHRIIHYYSAVNAALIESVLEKFQLEKRRMDLKTVQQQLKANIAKHQMLVNQMNSSNPTDTSNLQANLLEIRKHITKLGVIQKNLAKPKQNQPFQSSDQSGEVFENGSADNLSSCYELETHKTRVKSLDVNHISDSAPSASGSLISNANEIQAVFPLKLPQSALSIHKVPTNAKSSSSLVSLNSMTKMVNKSVGSEPLNLSSNSSRQNKLISFPVGLFKKNVPKDVRSEPQLKKVFVQPPMKLGMPTNSSNSSTIRIIPPSMFKPVHKSGLLRLSGPDCSMKLSTPKEFSRYVISVTNAPSGHATPKIIPATSTNQIQMGTVQNSWLDERKLFANQGNLPLENYDHHKASAFQHSKLKCSTSCEFKSVESEPLPLSKTIRSFSAPAEHSSKKISFLGQVNLIPTEKAEKMRNRRYGRRRAVAHPVYSGGLYVSHTAADSSKRVIPPELLDIGLETIPTKRPRGRPKGSTNKRSFSPNQIANGVDEEYYRILQQAKPSDVPPVEQNKVDDVCEVCNKPGEFLMCDTCSRLYHMSCLTPPLQEVPLGMWYCSICKSKIEDQKSAPKWPGLLSVMQSFFAFNTRRDISLTNAREKVRLLKNRKCKLTEQKKLLAGVLKEKVCNKAKLTEYYQQSMRECERLTSLLEKLRCVINKNLEIES